MASKRMAAAIGPTLSSAQKSARARGRSTTCFGSTHTVPRHLTGGSAPQATGGKKKRKPLSTKKKKKKGTMGTGMATSAPTAGAIERTELESVIAALEEDYHAEQARYVEAVEAAGGASVGPVVLDHDALRDASEQLSLKSWQLSTLRALTS